MLIFDRLPCELPIPFVKKALTLLSGWASIPLEENSSLVPILTAPVLVTWRVGLAGTPRSQPLMKGLAMARTWLGARGTSKAWEMAVPPLRALSMV